MTIGTRTVPIEDLRKFLSYDPETGKLTFKAQAERLSTHWSAERWNRSCAGKPAFDTPSGQGYLQGKIRGQKLMTHRVIWALVYGEWPPNIDHINGDRADNRLANLRAATPQENQKNKKRGKSNTSGFVGVSFIQSVGKYRASVWDGGRHRFLGYFDDPEEAARVRKIAERELGYHENHGRA